jgi:hypothetical protein
MALLLSAGMDASAALISFQDRASFDAAISGWSANQTNFESAAAGDMYGAGAGPAGSGFTLAYTSGSGSGLTPTVSEQFWTTSGVRYLGTDNPDSAFEAGDSLTFTFTNAMQAFGLYVIGTGDIGEGDITLTSGLASIGNASVAQMTDSAGSFAYFLGFVSSDASTFNSVTLHNLTPGDTRLLGIALDDVILALDDGRDPPTGIPEPGTLWLALVGMLAFGTAWRRRR